MPTPDIISWAAICLFLSIGSLVAIVIVCARWPSSSKGTGEPSPYLSETEDQHEDEDEAPEPTGYRYVPPPITPERQGQLDLQATVQDVVDTPEHPDNRLYYIASITPDGGLAGINQREPFEAPLPVRDACGDITIADTRPLPSDGQSDIDLRQHGAKDIGMHDVHKSVMSKEELEKKVKEFEAYRREAQDLPKTSPGIEAVVAEARKLAEAAWHERGESWRRVNCPCASTLVAQSRFTDEFVAEARGMTVARAFLLDADDKPIDPALLEKSFPVDPAKEK